jgi:peptidoglycan/LPS O-acetylase OafA/YrhL
MSSGNDRTLAGLQIMRAVAALMVAVHHAMEVPRPGMGASVPPDWLTTAGAAGVDIFFVISGFIMMAVSFPQGRAAIDSWSFLRRRVARIYPFYWVTLGIILVGWQIGIFKSLSPANRSLADIARSLLLAPSDTLILSVAWTLVHEMNFYLLFALMLWTRSALACLLGVTGFLLLQMALGGYASDPAVSLFLTRPIMLEFCFGMALGYAYAKGLLPKRIPWALPTAALACVTLAPLFIPHGSTGGLDADDRVWAWGIPAAVLVAACVSWPIEEGPLSRAWVLLGDASYAIYLLHPFVMLGYGKALGAFRFLLHMPQAPLILGATVLSAAVGTAAHVAVERPISKAARRLLLWERPRARAKQPA